VEVLGVCGKDLGKKGRKNMEFYGDRLLPRGLANLMYEVTPPSVRARMKVIALPKRDRAGILASTSGRRSGYTIRFYPTVILQHPHHGDVQQFNMWRDFLHTALHELGHIETRQRYVFYHERQETDLYFHRYIESLADGWATEMTAMIVSRNPRLGQPCGWIGGLAGRYILRHAKWAKKTEQMPNADLSQRIISIRAHRCGGQLTLSDIFSEIPKPSYYFRLEKKFRTRLRRLAKRETARLGIIRTFTDSAGREHLFFNYGEAKIVATAVWPHVAALYANVSSATEVTEDIWLKCDPFTVPLETEPEGDEPF